MEINNPDTVLELVSEGNKVVAYMRGSEPYHIILPIDRDILNRITEAGVPGFFDFGDFGVLYLRYMDHDFLALISPSIIIILDREATYPDFLSIFAVLVDEVGKFAQQIKVPELGDYRTLGQARREILSSVRALEEMYRSYMGAFDPQEASFLFATITRLKGLAFQIEDRREMMRIDMLKPPAGNRVQEILLFALMVVVFSTILPFPLSLVVSILTIAAALFFLIKFKNP